MTSGTALPPTLYKSRRSRENKFKWYLILVISIVFIVLAVTVIALTIYLTSDNETVGEYTRVQMSLNKLNEIFASKKT
jgi:hypothetical protein